MRSAALKWRELRHLTHLGAKRGANVIGNVVERPPIDDVVNRRGLPVRAMLDRSVGNTTAREFRHGHSVETLLPADFLLDIRDVRPRDRGRHRQIAFHRLERIGLIRRNGDAA